ncbi:RNA-binding protein [bacterium]|nr:MAG: RNA-binding protein [bacterium]
MKSVVETVVRNLVDHPDQVEISEEEYGRQINFVVRVAEGDRGNLIGRNGTTIQALRTLLNGLGQRRRLRVDVDLVD